MKKKFLGLLAAGLLATSLSYGTVVEGGTDNFHYPLVYVENQTAQHKINTTIAEWVGKAEALRIPDMRTVSMSYEVTYEGPDFISVVLDTHQFNKGAAHGMYEQQGLVFNAKTGDLVPLSYFVHMPSPAKLQQLIENGTVPLYNQNFTERLDPQSTFSWDPNGEHVKYISASYYLAGNGTIVLIYQPYELAAYAYGATRLVLTPAVIQELNKRY